jgi:hypothetical protein
VIDKKMLDDLERISNRLKKYLQRSMNDVEEEEYCQPSLFQCDRCKKSKPKLNVISDHCCYSHYCDDCYDDWINIQSRGGVTNGHT